MEKSSSSASDDLEQPLARVSYDSACDADASDGFEVWQDVCRPVFETAPECPIERFRSTFEWFNVDGLIFNRTAYGAMRFERHSRHLDLDYQDLLSLHLHERGRERIDVAGRSFEIAPGRVVLQDWAYAYSSHTSATRQICVLVPRRLLAALPPPYEGPPIVTWLADSPAGQLLSNALIAVFQSLPELRREAASEVAAGFLGLLNGLIAARTMRWDAPDLEMGVRNAMKAYVLRHLDDPLLSTDQLCERFRCSRSTLYRLFRQDGGASGFIREQRLLACQREISRVVGGRPIALSDVGEKWGFSDSAYFYRAFKRRFGMTPGEVRSSAIDMNAAVRDGDTLDVRPQPMVIHEWLRSSTVAR